MLRSKPPPVRGHRSQETPLRLAATAAPTPPPVNLGVFAIMEIVTDDPEAVGEAVTDVQDVSVNGETR